MFPRLLFIALLLTSAFASSAQAEDATDRPEHEPAEVSTGPLTISWTGPEECGSQNALDKETRRLLGAYANTAGVNVRARAVSLSGAGFRVELELEGNVEGARSLEAAQCREAIVAAAVVLALAINPEALLHAPTEAQEEGPPEPEPEPKSDPAPEPKPPGPAPRSEGLRPFLQAAGRVGGGLAPFPAWGAELAVGIEWGWFRAQASGFLSPSAGQDLQPTGQAKFLSAGGGLDVCFRAIQLSPAELRVCPGFTFSTVTASASGLEDSQSQSGFFYVPRAQAEVGVRLHDQATLVVGGGIQAPTTSAEFQAGSEAQLISVHQVKPGGLARLGFELILDNRARSLSRDRPGQAL